MITLHKQPEYPSWAEDNSAYYYASFRGWAISDTREHAKLKHDQVFGEAEKLQVEYFLPDHRKFDGCDFFRPIDKDGNVYGKPLA